MCTPLHYTPGQLRDTVGLSKETFRHWKRVLPAFSPGRGHAPSFSPGDVLASAILRRVTETCGVRIGYLTDVATKIFDICNQTSWDVLANDILIVDLPSRDCMVLQDPADIPVKNTVVVCPLGPVITAFRDDLLRSRWPVRKTPLIAIAAPPQKRAARGREK